MKKVFMSLAVAAAMFAAVSCACNNNSEKAQECAGTECADCAGCDKAEEACCDKAGAEGCEKECCKKAEGCDKECDKQCDKQCEKKACCDSTKVDCKKAE